MWRAVLLIVYLLPAPVFAWTPPLGIPVPTFPSDLDVARPTFPSPWTSAQAGWYFVGLTGCTNTSNPNGWPGNPRCSLAGVTLVTGDRAVLDETIAGFTVSVTATSGNPIWVMGYQTGASRPVLTSRLTLSGQYLIVSDLTFNYDAVTGPISASGSNIMVRDSSLSDDYGGAGQTNNGSCAGLSGSNIVFYRNTVIKCGDWTYTIGDIDRHCIKISSGGGSPADIWIVDNELHNCLGDGVQIGDQGNAASAINRIYLGRNLAYENQQTGFWTKNATTVIMSENESYTRGMGGQYEPVDVWFIDNYIHDSQSGIVMQSGQGGPWYAIGNVLKDITTEAHTCGNAALGAGIGMRSNGSGGLIAIHNTMDNVDTALFADSTSAIRFAKNIVATQASGSACTMIDIDNGSMTYDKNLYEDAADAPAAETNEVTGDPVFVSSTDLRIQTTSPAKDVGGATAENAFTTFSVDYGIAITTDRTDTPAPMGGTSRPSNTNWDLGADEFAAAADNTAPVVTITGPVSDPTYSTQSTPLTTLAGTASDAVGVTSCTWSNDRGGSGAASGTTSWTVASITLSVGANVLTVDCQDAANNHGTDVLTVTYTVPAAGGTSFGRILR